MKTLSLTVSSFASTSLCIVFIFCLHFCILSHFEIIRALWNYGSLLQHIFCWNRTIKRKLKSCFFGCRYTALPNSLNMLMILFFSEYGTTFWYILQLVVQIQPIFIRGLGKLSLGLIYFGEKIIAMIRETTYFYTQNFHSFSAYSLECSVEHKCLP